MRTVFLKVFFLIIITKGLPASLQETIDSLELQYHNTPISAEKIVLAEKLINYYYNVEKTKALFYGNEAIQMATQLKKNNIIADLHLTVGRILDKLADYNEAIVHYQIAYDIFSRQNNENDVAFSLYRIGNVNKKLGFYQKSVENCFKGLAIYEKMNDSIGMARIYNCLGSIYKYQEEYNKSLNYYSKSLAIHQQRNCVKGIAMAYNNIGIVYEIMNNNMLAKCYYEKCLELNKQLGSLENEGEYMNNLGIIYMKEGSYIKAKEYFLRSITIFLSIYDRKRLAISYNNMGKYYEQQDSLEKGIEYHFIALKIAKEVGANEQIKNFYLNIHDIYIKQNNIEKAYEYYIKYSELNQELFNLEKSKKIVYIEMEYQQIKASEQATLQKQWSKFLIILVSSISVMLIVIIGLIFQRQQNRLQREKLEKDNIALQKRQMESELEYKNKELTTIALQQVRKDEISELVVQKLKQTKYNLKVENKPIIQSIINELSNDYSVPDAWKEFEIRFLEIHNKFYTNLNNSFPGLTPNEQRLCAFLKLNMSTKEISAITQQTPHSINIARGRLRKKLDISGLDVSLNQFLASL